MQTSYLTSALWFVAIVAAIPLALWLLKRTPLAGVGGRAGAPRLVAMLPVSNQHKLMTVEVGQGEERIWLVVGVSPQGLRTLHTMTAQPEVEAPTPPAAAFAQLLGRLRGDKGDHGA
ncbi:MAG: flagellar biosynthetic protein FliO [Burkholderiales bacterium]|nr:flagellar biosynthetic protein FliO [Burkholderiales bacterium]MDE1929588.1 flagellar biosynthetic protein FliO [Burkholderiales bacterium]MDE2160775.1 flagellar biosynthetic protein FliO [Burkholderiales bacterium]MDE2505375.1 flagellar biosynthetic protein FliO [Burkholderiales bacterium]